jgi:hypothetical protein
MAGAELGNSSRASDCLNNSGELATELTTNRKRHFLDCRSLAEMAITLVVLGVMFLLPTAFLCVILGFILGLPPCIALFVPLGFWALAIIVMWRRFVRLGRAWSEPRLATTEFSYFQWVSMAFVLLLFLAFHSAETRPAINAVRLFLNALFVMVNLAYVTLAVGIKAKLPKKIFAVLVISLLVAVLSIKMN